MSWTTEAMIGFDLETTGVDPMTCLPVSFALVYMNGSEVTKVRTALINPGIPIPEGATEVHKITDEMVQERGGTLEASVVGIAGELLAAAYAGVPVVGMNCRYDLTIIDRLYAGYAAGSSMEENEAVAKLLRAFPGAETDRIGLRGDGWNGNVIDISVIDKKLDKWRKGSRTLLALCAHYGVDLGEAAHTAAGDAEASVRVALALAKKYPQIDTEPYLLHAMQVGWRREWAEDFGAYLAKKGEKLEDDAGDWPLIGDKGLQTDVR